jgi:hypothetical protein
MTDAADVVPCPKCGAPMAVGRACPGYKLMLICMQFPPKNAPPDAKSTGCGHGLFDADAVAYIRTLRRETTEERLRREGKDVDDPANYGVPHPDEEDG